MLCSSREGVEECSCFGQPGCSAGDQPHSLSLLHAWRVPAVCQPRESLRQHQLIKAGAHCIYLILSSFEERPYYFTVKVTELTVSAVGCGQMSWPLRALASSSCDICGEMNQNAHWRQQRRSHRFEMPRQGLCSERTTKTRQPAASNNT